MEFMLLFSEPRGALKGGAAELAAMQSFAAKLAGQGKLRRGAPLSDESAGVRVRVRGGSASISDGPFAETKEVLGGFCIVDVADRAEAVDIARRCPHAEYGVVEVHRVAWRDAVADSGEGVPFLFTFHMEPGLTDPDGAKLREMLDFSETLRDAGKFIETAPLAGDPPPARVDRHNGKLAVTDGPFAETKEGVGGYSLIRAESRAEAIDIATRYPHAKWGPVHVREILFFDPT
jgi:hypothetical protein